MTRVQAALDEGEFDTKMILQVHDELLFDMVIDEETEIKEMVVEEMKSALPLNVPITVDVGIGYNWLEAH